MVYQEITPPPIPPISILYMSIIDYVQAAAPGPLAFPCRGARSLSLSQLQRSTPSRPILAEALDPEIVLLWFATTSNTLNYCFNVVFHIPDLSGSHCSIKPKVYKISKSSLKKYYSSLIWIIIIERTVHQLQIRYWSGPDRLTPWYWYGAMIRLSHIIEGCGGGVIKRGREN